MVSCSPSWSTRSPVGTLPVVEHLLCNQPRKALPRTAVSSPVQPPMPLRGGSTRGGWRKHPRGHPPMPTASSSPARPFMEFVTKTDKSHWLSDLAATSVISLLEAPTTFSLLQRGLPSTRRRWVASHGRWCSWIFQCYLYTYMIITIYYIQWLMRVVGQYEEM